MTKRRTNKKNLLDQMFPVSKRKEGKKTAITGFLAAIVGSSLAFTFGRPSLIAGIPAFLAGSFSGHKTLSSLGVAMVATGLVVPPKENGEELSGLDLQTRLGRAKERLMEFKDRAMHNTYLDKVTGIEKHRLPVVALQTPSETSLGELDFSSLDEIEDQLVEAASVFESESGESEMEQDNLSNAPSLELEEELVDYAMM